MRFKLVVQSLVLIAGMIEAQGAPASDEPLALWLAFCGRASEALPFVEKSSAPTARRVAGLILWRGLGDAGRPSLFQRFTTGKSALP